MLYDKISSSSIHFHVSFNAIKLFGKWNMRIEKETTPLCVNFMHECKVSIKHIRS